jgi:GTP-binding protein
MPQTYFVLKKALARHLPVIVVINKIDKSAARPDWTMNQVFDLFVKLGAPDSILDFPVVYASARDGYASDEPVAEGNSMGPLYEKIISYIPAPKGSSDAPLQMHVSSIDYSPYLGRLGIGKITGGCLAINKDIAVALRDGSLVPTRITKLYRFIGNQKVPIEEAGVGELVAVAGMEEVTVGVTYTDPENPCPLPPVAIDPPTLSMNFVPNSSPFAGREGRFVTSRHLKDRLERETLSDVALVVEEMQAAPGFKVSGRGELHLSILIERMRREGYEFQVTKPQVIMKKVGAKLLEPYEELIIDVDKQYMGTVIEKLGSRKGRMLEMIQGEGMTRILFKIPTRGLLGFKSEFMTDTKGMGVMNYIFSEYGEYAGDMKNRRNGAIVAQEAGTTVAYALFHLQDRGNLFMGAGISVYSGQIIGEHCRENDLVVNPSKGKKMTNMRAAGSDENVVLTPHIEMSLEDCITFINDDEFVEITPKTIRLRKRDSILKGKVISSLHD